LERRLDNDDEGGGGDDGEDEETYGRKAIEVQKAGGW